MRGVKKEIDQPMLNAEEGPFSDHAKAADLLNLASALAPKGESLQDDRVGVNKKHTHGRSARSPPLP